MKISGVPHSAHFTSHFILIFGNFIAASMKIWFVHCSFCVWVLSKMFIKYTAHAKWNMVCIDRQSAHCCSPSQMVAKYTIYILWCVRVYVIYGGKHVWIENPYFRVESEKWIDCVLKQSNSNFEYCHLHESFTNRLSSHARWKNYIFCCYCRGCRCKSDEWDGPYIECKICHSQRETKCERVHFVYVKSTKFWFNHTYIWPQIMSLNFFHSKSSQHGVCQAIQIRKHDGEKF